MPFVTEQVWQALSQVAPRAGMPEPEPAGRERLHRPLAGLSRAWDDPEAERRSSSSWQEAITVLRNLRAERNVPKDGEDRARSSWPRARRRRRGSARARRSSGA